MTAEKQMDESEKLAKKYLLHRGFKDEEIVYEPNGRDTIPDFLVDKEVAVEVRRLNQNQLEPNGKKRGLEEDAIPLQRKMHKLLRSLGPPTSTGSWFVSYSFRRPLEGWRDIKSVLKRELVQFRDFRSPGPTSIKISKSLSLNNSCLL